MANLHELDFHLGELNITEEDLENADNSFLEELLEKVDGLRADISKALSKRKLDILPDLMIDVIRFFGMHGKGSIFNYMSYSCEPDAAARINETKEAGFLKSERTNGEPEFSLNKKGEEIFKLIQELE